MSLIGLYSPAMGSGKTELTNVLVEKHGYVGVKFAGTLKAMAQVLLSDLGIDKPEEFTDGHLKSVIIEPLGVTPRYLMQTLGTEWGRGQVKDSLWVDVAVTKIQRLLKDGWNVVVDDMRFPNEFDAIQGLGGLTVRVVRPGLKDPTGHISEGNLDGHTFDYNLFNEHGLQEWRGLASHFHDTISKR